MAASSRLNLLTFLPFVVKSEQKYRRDMKIRKLSEQLSTGEAVCVNCFVQIQFAEF